MKGYNEIDYARDLIRWMESGQKIRDRGVAAGFELPHSLAKLPETATPPLAPCEPSAEFVKAADAVWGALRHTKKCGVRDGCKCDCNGLELLSAYESARALFVKEKLT